MKKYSIYKDGFDRAWYESSNVMYSECDDKEGELKVVRVVFKKGVTYEYTGVDVNDYLRFREAQSQGIAFREFIKKYPYQRVDDRDLSVLEEDLQRLLKRGFDVRTNADGSFDVIKMPEMEKHSFKRSGMTEDDAIRMFLKSFNMLV